MMLYRAAVNALIVTLFFILFYTGANIVAAILRSKLRGRIPLRTKSCISVMSYMLDDSGNLREVPLDLIPESLRKFPRLQELEVFSVFKELEVAKRVLREMRSERSLLRDIVSVVVGVFIVALIIRRAEAVSGALAGIVIATLINRQQGSIPIALCIRDASGKLRKIPLDSIPDELGRQLQEKIPWFQEIMEGVRKVRSERKPESFIPPYRYIAVGAATVFIASLIMFLLFPISS